MYDVDVDHDVDVNLDTDFEVNVNVDREVEINFAVDVDVEGNVDAVFDDFVDGCFFRRVFVRPATSLSTPVLIIDSVNTAMVYTYGSVVPLAFFSFNPLIF